MQRPPTDLLAPKRTLALVFRGRLPAIERFLADLKPIAEREDLLIVFVKVSEGRLTIRSESEFLPLEDGHRR